MCLQFMIDNMILKDSNCLWPHSLKCMDCCLPNNLFCNCLLKTLTFTNDSRKGGGVNISCGLLTPSKCINKFLNPFVRVPLHTPLPYPLNDGLFLSIIERGGERERKDRKQWCILTHVEKDLCHRQILNLHSTLTKKSVYATKDCLL